MYDEEDEQFESDKFDECYMCRYRFCEKTCDTCDYGEEFEQEDPDEMDRDFIL